MSSIDRRRFLEGAGTLPLLPYLASCAPQAAQPPPAARPDAFRRVRPTDAAWPDAVAWERLDREVGGQLIRVRSPLAACAGAPGGEECADLFRKLKNPYFIGDEVALTQTLGWTDAWVSEPSMYAVAARNASDVAAAVNFARMNRLRLVVKGGGHSYHGTSNAKDSLLVWTKRMNEIVLHDAFVAVSCTGQAAPQPAVSIGAGAVWLSVYNEVSVKAGRYVQGGGCLTVGVGGLVQSGGFGSFSKNYGTAAAALLEAEMVTADGVTRIANACTNADLFWALKGGGGGSFGVVTRVTLGTRELPVSFGAVNLVVGATTDAAYRRLIARIVELYGQDLFNPHWGEQLVFRPDNVLAVRMVFQGLDQSQAEAVWRPFLDWLEQSSGEFRILTPTQIVAVPARRFWDPAFLRGLPGIVVADDRPGALEGNVFWAGDASQVGQFLSGFQSLWLPAALLKADQQARLCDALYAASRHWELSLHVNKGLAGAPADAIESARDTATNPAVLDAFALAISGGAEPPSYPGIADREPDVAIARERRGAIDAAMKELRRVVPAPASYVSECDYFEEAWQRAAWGPNYPRLLDVKNKYDPDRLFVVHHGVGSEGWSADGFTRVS